MAAQHDYIPHSSDAFNAWQSNFTDIVSQKLIILYIIFLNLFITH
jgi:hypothetical protein